MDYTGYFIVTSDIKPMVKISRMSKRGNKTNSTKIKIEFVNFYQYCYSRCVYVAIVFTFLHLDGKFWAHKSSFTPPLIFY